DLDPALCDSYLHHNIRYLLGAEELSGAAAFLQRAAAAGLFPARPLRFFDDGRAEHPITIAKTAPPLPVPRSEGATPASAPRTIDSLLADAAAGVRLRFDEALRLYDEAPTLELGA